MKGMSVVGYFINKNEHYPVSDEFIENYQQQDDGNSDSYITFAHKTGHLVNAKEHEPNQKWHLLEAYYLMKLAKHNEGIGVFRCPELLLWMAEAAGVNPELVTEAAGYAKEKIDEIRNNDANAAYASKAASYMNQRFKEKYNKTLQVMIAERVEEWQCVTPTS